MCGSADSRIKSINFPVCGESWNMRQEELKVLADVAIETGGLEYDNMLNLGRREKLIVRNTNTLLFESINAPKQWLDGRKRDTIVWLDEEQNVHTIGSHIYFCPSSEEYGIRNLLRPWCVRIVTDGLVAVLDKTISSKFKCKVHTDKRSRREFSMFHAEVATVAPVYAAAVVAHENGQSIPDCPVPISEYHCNADFLDTYAWTERGWRAINAWSTFNEALRELNKKYR